jgi:hypothetical protein
MPYESLDAHRLGAAPHRDDSTLHLIAPHVARLDRALNTRDATRRHASGRHMLSNQKNWHDCDAGAPNVNPSTQAAVARASSAGEGAVTRWNVEANPLQGELFDRLSLQLARKPFREHAQLDLLPFREFLQAPPDIAAH